MYKLVVAHENLHLLKDISLPRTIHNCRKLAAVVWLLKKLRCYIPSLSKEQNIEDNRLGIVRSKISHC